MLKKKVIIKRNVERIQKVIYLGNKITPDGKFVTQINSEIGQTRGVFQKTKK